METNQSQEIPEHTKRGIDNYVKYGVRPGGFLYAFLSNNLGAIALADAGNRASLYAIWCYCFREIPDDCWGSPGIVNAWIEKKRLEREATQEGKDHGTHVLSTDN